MKLPSIKHLLSSYIKNLAGYSVKRNIVVIECDDWGGIRMPSLEVFERLQKVGLKLQNSRYERNDTVEDSNDLEALFSILEKHRDKFGRSAVMTPFCNMVNPDFQKIREAEFTNYYFERFPITYARYRRRNDIMDLWRQGINANLFVPEYHGREHISVGLWLEVLRSGNKQLRFAFDNEFVAVPLPETPKIARSFRPNFYISSDKHFDGLKNSIEEGVDIFNEEFGVAPQVFNAPNGVFVPRLNQSLLSKKIFYNAVPKQRMDMNEQGNYQPTRFVTGQKSAEGLTYYVRNCNFEPSDEGYKGIGHVLTQIRGAFAFGKAAIIGTHRVNFVGGLSEANRKNGLHQLDLLLTGIVSRWPDVEFMSSREFTSVLSAPKES